VSTLGFILLIVVIVVVLLVVFGRGRF